MHIDQHQQRAMFAATIAAGDPLPAAPIRRQPRPWLQLLNAVLKLAGGEAEMVRHAEKPWASATFSGSRHTVLLQFNGIDGVIAGEAFIEALPDHVFTLPGKLVADAAIGAVEQVAGPDPHVTIEAEFLLLDEI